jgi:hypothetical protein
MTDEPFDSPKAKGRAPRAPQPGEPAGVLVNHVFVGRLADRQGHADYEGRTLVSPLLHRATDLDAERSATLKGELYRPQWFAAEAWHAPTWRRIRTRSRPPAGRGSRSL